MEIPAGASALLALFEERSDLKFPDLDVEVLREAVVAVDDAFAAVQALETQLEGARERLAAKQDALLAKAHRALAYARVFAEEDPALSERLSQVILPRGRKPSVARPEAVPIGEAVTPAPAPARRKRAAKNAETEALFQETAA